VLQIGVPILL